MRCLLIIMCILLLSSCYNDKSKVHDALPDAEASLTIEKIDSEAIRRRQDSLTFTSQHHYTNNYNFILKADSLALLTQQPEEIVSRKNLPEEISLRMDTDSVVIYCGDQLVVAEIRILPIDSVDSVWVQLARDQNTFGWIHESELLPAVVPDDPISQFIDVFSNTHLIWMLSVVGIMMVAYTFRKINRKKAKIVHFDDIPSLYPTALVLIVATAATMYATIQLFYPEMWRHFYYHPTLNPLSVPFELCIFLSLVWLMPIVGVAAVDDVHRHLPLEECLLYLSGLAAVCMANYIIFSITTLYYIGYPLLVVYVFFSIRRFNRHTRLVYFCGRCGKAIHHKGKCPYCGAINE